MKIIVLGGDGKLVERPPQSGEQTLVLPEPFGELKFIHSQHSEVATVPFAEGSEDKGIKEVETEFCLRSPDRTGPVQVFVKKLDGTFGIDCMGSDKPFNLTLLADAEPGLV